MQLALLLAGASPSPSATPAPPVDPSRVTPGLLGAVTFIVLIAAAYVLFRSLRRQLSRVPPTFDEQPPDS